jgi:phage-related protein
MGDRRVSEKAKKPNQTPQMDVDRIKERIKRLKEALR